MSGSGKGLKGFRLLAIVALVAAPSIAYGHSLLVNPVPRDKTDTLLKTGPCGGTAMMPLLKGQPVAQYDASSTVNIVWKETVQHGGCYQLQLSKTGDDKNFQILSQIDDPSNNPLGTRNGNVTFPAGVTCPNCTLRLIQVMKTDGGLCVPDASTEVGAYGGTQNYYYSCADIRIGDFPDAGALMDAGPPDEDAASQDDPDAETAGPGSVVDEAGHVTNLSSGGSRNLRAGAGDDGCSIGWSDPSGVSFLASLGIAAIAIARRRKKG